MADTQDKKQPIGPTLTVDQLGMLASVFADAMRESQKDPTAERIKEAHRLRVRGQQAEDRRIKEWREKACPHLREDNTSAIAWMENSDKITRGVCQRCNSTFDPSHPRYTELIRIPTRAANITYY